MSSFAPMLATTGSVLRGDDWVVEPKLDGWRAMVQIGDDRLSVRSRTGREISDRLPELQPLVHAIGCSSATLDGELVVGTGLPTDFYRLGARMASSSRDAAVTLAVFDLLEVDGDSLIGLPYSERRERLESLLDVGPAWVRVPSFADDPCAAFIECVRLGLEGVVAKRASSCYQPGKRSRDWVKTKAPEWRTVHGSRRHGRLLQAAARQ